MGDNFVVELFYCLNRLVFKSAEILNQIFGGLTKGVLEDGGFLIIPINEISQSLPEEIAAEILNL